MDEKTIQRDLARSVDGLTVQVGNLVYTEANSSFNKPWKAAVISLVKGLAFGFGSILGATVIVALFIFILSQIQLVPVVGDFVKSLLEYMQNAGVKGV
ncbi:MAG: DUF5665 domain-containing protein [Candidatus Gracilibacteria bacterium]|jgi:uncharacterized membrane protein|nr:MAG: hypothetical protein US92_C0001G0090 [Candidatus Peregrinibacteria bacterium GW2011_GWA2_38_36]KKR07146.1 MAG: hypothetical protein UT33_C0005G0090 [Candidatus Peregrinibacteria bacterium GW2011_GWC2_39_14]